MIPAKGGSHVTTSPHAPEPSDDDDDGERRDSEMD